MRVLIELESRAQALQNANKYDEAIPLLMKIIEIRPDYEHGMPYYSLACCFEDSGQYQQAGVFFRKALEYGKNNSMFLGGFAEYLYSHGTAEEALKMYLKYVSAVGEDSVLARNVDPIIAELREGSGGIL